jgi:DNA-directed RNA polymerase specialized sigma24 family protein
MTVITINKLFELIEEHLPRTESQAVILHYRYNLCAKEISKTMNVRSSTVRGYISEGLNRFRRILTDIEVRAVVT